MVTRRLNQTTISGEHSFLCFALWRYREEESEGKLPDVGNIPLHNSIHSVALAQRGSSLVSTFLGNELRGMTD